MIRPNPHYGSGRFRRRIVLQQRNLPGGLDGIDAELEDCNHRLALSTCHDGQHIVGIRAHSLRIPYSSCPGAATALEALVGQPLPDRPGDLARAGGQPRQHCTHLFDLLELALLHRLRATPRSEWQVVVEDEHNGMEQAEVCLDRRLIHRWQIHQGRLQTSLSPEGQALIGGGFGRWAQHRFQGLELEAAAVLQRGYFVAQARRYDVDSGAGQRADSDGMPTGVCYTYQPERAAEATRLANTVRDFSDPARPPLAEHPLR